MNYCHRHNLVAPGTAGTKRSYGIRVSLPDGDTMMKILGNNWEQLLWYASEADRDAAYANMATRHGYNRNTDTPTQVLEKITR